MRAPGRGGQEFDFLGGDQRPELRGEAIDEIAAREHRRPMRPPIGVVVELPDVDELVDHAGIGLKIADQFGIVTTLLERRKAELLVEFDRFPHFANVQGVGAHFVQRHGLEPP